LDRKEGNNRKMEKTQQRVSSFAFLDKYYYSFQFKEDELGGACDMHWRGEKRNMDSFRWKT
jgi:hypothetical protein